MAPAVPRRPGPRWPAAAALVFLLARPAAAQLPADTITGRVLGRDGTPIPRAGVRLSVEGGREQSVRADEGGGYRFVVPGGSGSYVVTASAFGYLSFSAAVERAPGAARIDRDLRLTPRPVVLDTVTAVTILPDPDRPTAAERAARWSAVTSEGFPVDPGSFAEVAALEPGVMRTGPDGAGLSIAGQSPDQNGATVDGATYGGGSLPTEGVRSVGVFTNSYDVARGQFSGGQIAATTIGGTNRWGGSLSGYLEDPSLRYGGPPGDVAGRPGRRLRLNGGGGGALSRDRLFVYGALDLTHGTAAGTGLELLDPASLRRLDVSPDSARRLVEIARRLGAASAAPSAGPATRDAASALARVDLALSRHQSLTARLDGRAFDGSGLAASPLRLLGSGGEQRSRHGGLLLQHSWGRGRWSNELRGYRSAGHSGAGASALAPAGVVRVRSELEDGTTGSSVLGFGGVPFAMREEHSLWELGNEVKVGAAGGHVLKAGVLLQEERALSEAVSGRGGTFTFNSLADLEAGRPASFTRSLAEEPGEAVRRYAALYLGDGWRPSDRLNVVFGLRLDGTRYGRRAALAPAADSLLGGRGSRVPSDLVLAPRFGFRYDLRGRGNWTVEGGAGGFGGAAPLGSLASRWSETGAGEATLVCVGPAAPAPEWARYGADPGAIPSSCGDQGSIFSAAAPRATVFDPAFGAPRTWRVSLGAGGRLTARWGIGVDALLVRGTHLPSAAERNFHGEAAFTLADEGGRPVYAAADEIDPATGGIAPGASRAAPSLGSVLELGSRGRSWTGQLTAALNGPFGRGGQIGIFYTLTHARTLGGGVPAPGAPSLGTSGDPTELEWVDAPFAHRHLLQAVLRARVTRRLRVSAIGSLASGLPFTPLVGGDVNGDGYANDRAFVFDPASAANPALAGAMRRLLDEAPAGARRCLREQAGRIASAGACRTAWSPSLDVRAELLAVGNVNTRRLALTLTASNVTAGLDYLLHGPDGLRGWGQYPVPDATLLQVRGFDPDRRAFAYEVNPAFGRPLGGGALRLPFRVALQARVTLGADPRYQPLMQAIELGSGRARESVRADVARRVRNVPAVLLALSATDTAALSLTSIQRARLRALADSLAPEVAVVVDSLTDVYTQDGPFTPARRARLQELTGRALELAESAVELTRERLTPEQWARVPAWLSRPATQEEIERPPTIDMSLPMGSP